MSQDLNDALRRFRTWAALLKPGHMVDSEIGLTSDDITAVGKHLEHIVALPRMELGREESK